MPDRVTNQTLARQLGELQGKMELLIKKVDHNCDASQTGDREIMKMIAGLRGEIKDNWTKHDTYHSDNEHKWGPWAFLKKYPAVSVGIGIVLAGGGGYGAVRFVEILKFVLTLMR